MIIKKNSPRKVIPRKDTPKEGIVKEPSNATADDPQEVHVLEFVYDNPHMIKKMFNMFKSMAVQDIRLRFEPEIIKIKTTDRVKKSTIYSEIYSDKLNRYYCEKTFEIGLIPNDIQKITSTINADINKITIISTRRFEKSKLRIVLTCNELDVYKDYTIDINSVDDYDWGITKEIELEKDYPIKFELTTKFFKKAIADAKLLADVIRIEKNGDGPLDMSYAFTNKRGDQHSFFKNNKKINLRSTITSDDLFSCSVYLDHIKPISTSLITDSINISASKTHKLIFTALLDQEETGKEKIENSEVCRIYILTDIINLQ